jgi:hypothetical protein
MREAATMIRFWTFLTVAFASLALPSLATEVTFDHDDCLEETGRFAGSTNNDDLTQSAHQLMLCLAELSYRTNNMSPTIDRDNPGDKYYKVWPNQVVVGIGDENPFLAVSGSGLNIPVPEGGGDGYTFPVWNKCRGPSPPVPFLKNERLPASLGIVIEVEELMRSPEQKSSVITNFIETVSKDPSLGPLSPRARMEAIVGSRTFQSEYYGEGSKFKNIYADLKPLNPYAPIQIETSAEAWRCAPNEEPWIRGPSLPIQNPKFERIYMIDID